ncbi:MAG: class I SAM-dependent methyltransferase, partial [Buchnera aphidicola]|nr:class I SAM-dependent methyltransferase [Buchnera aphidicola]
VVLDGTAGLGKDAFILSFLGCTVYMIERNPVIAALLQDGLERAYENEKIGSWIKKRLHLIYDNSVQMLNLSIIKPDVIYLDPMYPDKKKSLPKKDMQIFQKFIGRD